MSWIGAGLQMAGIALGFTGIGVSLVIAGSYLQYRGSKVRSTEDRQKGVETTFASTEAALPVIYGEAIVGGRVVDVRVDENSTDNKDIALVVAFCLGSEDGSGVEDWNRIWFDDEIAVTKTSEGDIVIPPRWRDEDDNPLIDVQFYSGTDGQVVDTQLNTRFPSVWDSNSRLSGVCYARIILTYDEDVFSRGVPNNIRARIRGSRVYDPRTGLVGHSDTPALCLMDYLRSRKYGAGVPLDEIDVASVISEANFQEEVQGSYTFDQTWISYGRGSCNGAVDTGVTIDRNMDFIASSGRMDVIYQNERFRFFTTKTSEPSGFVVGPDNTIGDIEIVRRGNKDVPTSVTVSFVDRNNDFTVQETSFPGPGNEVPFVDADGGFINEPNVSIPLCVDRAIAYNIAQVIFSEAREDVDVFVTVDESGTSLQYGDIVTFYNDSVGFEGAEFWVRGVGLSSDLGVLLHLTPYHDSAYDLDPTTTYPKNPDTQLPNPLQIEPPTNLALFSDENTALATQEGQLVPRIFATWVDPEDTFATYIEVEYKKELEEKYTPNPNVRVGTEQAFIVPVTSGDVYDVRVRAINRTGARSVWVTGQITASTAPSQFGLAPLDTVEIEYYFQGSEPYARVILEVSDPYNRLIALNPVRAFAQDAPITGVPPLINYVPETAQGAGPYEGRYVWEILLKEKHLGVVAYAIYWEDFELTQHIIQKILWLDIGDIANIVSVDVTNDGDLAIVRVKGDADSVALHAEEFRDSVWSTVLDPDPPFTGGTLFSSDLRGSFTVDRYLEESRQMRVFGENSVGQYGPAVEFGIDSMQETSAAVAVTVENVRPSSDPPSNGERGWRKYEMDIKVSAQVQRLTVILDDAWPGVDISGSYSFNVTPGSNFTHTLQDGSQDQPTGNDLDINLDLLPSEISVRAFSDVDGMNMIGLVQVLVSPPGFVDASFGLLLPIGEGWVV